jgi:hypothetical protein
VRARSALPVPPRADGDLRSVWDFALLAAFYKGVKYADPLIDTLDLPSPLLYTAAHFSLWALYTAAAGLVATGLWVIAHECGHQAFSESKAINNAVGWVLHSACVRPGDPFMWGTCSPAHSLGVPYHSWRITHAKHHASTGHMTEDQVFTPKTRSDIGLPAFNSEEENVEGSTVSARVMHELADALGDSPIVAAWTSFQYLVRASLARDRRRLTVPAAHRLARIPGPERVWPAPVPAGHEPLQPGREGDLPRYAVRPDRDLRRRHPDLARGHGRDGVLPGLP